MKLIITEKPSMAKKYREALKGIPDLRVANSFGHIEALADINQYLADTLGENNTWRGSIPHLPFVPSKFVHVIREEEAFAEIAKHLVQAEEVVLACDPDREGELIHRNIMEIAADRGLLKARTLTRVWLHSETASEIRKAFEQRKPYTDYEGYYQAARTREAVDWTVGLQLTRLYSVKYGRPGHLISVGRVQSWLLAEIVKRWRENKEHKPQTFWTYSFKTTDGVLFNLVDEEKKIRRFFAVDAEEQKKLVTIAGKPLAITAVEKKPFTEYAPALYDLKQLQKDAANRYKFTPDDTLKIAQALYETHELISYPRTDCNVLSPEEAKELGKAVALVERFPDYRQLLATVRTMNPDLALAKKYIGELQGHYAIIPVLSYDRNGVPTLSEEERKVFDLIVKRFLAALLPPAKGDTTEMLGKIEGFPFLARFKNYTDLGFKGLIGKELVAEEGTEEEEEKPLQVSYAPGQVVTGKLGEKKEETKPPALYNDAAILSLMEKAHLLVSDKALREALKEASGIGTAATRAGFIPTLIAREYIKKEKQVYVPTPLGLELEPLLPEELKVPDYSARLEHHLWNMVKGKGSITFDQFMRESLEFLRRVFGKIQGSETRLNQLDAADSLGPCPKCGKGHVLEREKCYACSDRNGCGFVLWKVYANAKLTKTELKNLLKNGETKKALKMKSKEGREFEARLKLNRESWKLDFLFEEKKSEAPAAPTSPALSAGQRPLSEKQIGVIERNAPKTVKKAVAKGDYEAGRRWL
ncbi:MAG TPA: DNA topoisomerase, partial [bacterium]|nr:DNA topoisomerase [bacterium]